jgi:hypothetical protein
VAVVVRINAGVLRRGGFLVTVMVGSRVLVELSAVICGLAEGTSVLSTVSGVETVVQAAERTSIHARQIIRRCFSFIILL